LTDVVATGLWPVGFGSEFTDKRPTGAVACIFFCPSKFI
jgi:hypothetical protein